MREFVRVQRVAVDHEALVEKLRHEIQHHVQKRHEIAVPLLHVREPVLEQRRQRRERAVVQKHERHGPRHLLRRAEGIAPVAREVPQHRQHERRQVRAPVRPVKRLVEERKAAELDQPSRAREEQKLPRAPKLRMLHSDRLLLQKVQ